MSQSVPEPVPGEPAPGEPASGESTGGETAVGPALGRERIQSIDILRGLAVLGILAMNIAGFTMPTAAYNNPKLFGGDGANIWVWFFNHLLFDQKFLPIFSMLFGAGLVLMYERGRRNDEQLALTYYRRNGLLILFGLLHAYLIWWGDILFFYGVCGLILFFFRKSSPRMLLVVGTCVFLMNIPINLLQGFGMEMMKAQADKVTAKQAEGTELGPKDKQVLKDWAEMSTMMAPSQEEVDRIVRVHRDGTYGEIFAERAKFVMFFQPAGILVFALWRCGGLMLLGMALMRLGVFSGERSKAFYQRMALAGYGIGLPLVAVGAFLIQRTDWDPFYFMKAGVHWNYVGSVGVSLGHVALLMLIVQGGLLTGLTERLKAVGRMAFTNYLMQSVVMTTVFYGYGFGLYGRADRLEQMGVVALMWIAQLVWSPIWLRHFRFGPAEWLWRTMTYGKAQPFRRL